LKARLDFLVFCVFDLGAALPDHIIALLVTPTYDPAEHRERHAPGRPRRADQVRCGRRRLDHDRPRIGLFMTD
jgi:hypothetical protein